MTIRTFLNRDIYTIVACHHISQLKLLLRYLCTDSKLLKTLENFITFSMTENVLLIT